MRRKRNELYCFSPLVMAITFTVELSLAAYTIWRYKMNEVARVATAMMVFLAVFQLAEFMVCEGGISQSLTWSRVGYVAITLLPPLGIHLIYAIAKTKKRPLLMPAYATAAGFSTFFIGVSSAFSGPTCLGNYVVFQVASGLGGLFGAYYYSWLAISLYLAWRFIQATSSANVRRALRGVMLGYIAFIVPTATANIVSPDTVHAIPSIMCGFAVIMAIILAVLVLPGNAPLRRRT